MPEIDTTFAITTLTDVVERLSGAVMELTEVLADAIVDADRAPNEREQKAISSATRACVDAAARINETIS